MPGNIPWDLNLYFLQPIYWLSVAVLTFLGWFSYSKKMVPEKNMLLFSVLIGVSQVGIIFGVSYFFNAFHGSQYSYDFLSILLNILYSFSFLIAMEFSRAYFCVLCSKINPLLIFILLAIIFTFISFPFSQFKLLTNPLTLFKFAGEYLLPRFSENLLATFLVMTGGPLASIIYLGIILLSRIVLPVTPNLTWTMAALLGTLIPLLSFYFLNARYEKDNHLVEKSKKPATSMTSWIIVLAVGVFLIWFNTGMLGVQPFLVSGGSMNPTFYAGDIIITKEVSLDAIQVNDVIRFHRSNYDVVHRVIGIQKINEGSFIFITKGDNNNTLDEPVLGAQISGKVLFKIPKIGWISIFLRTIFDRAVG